MLAFCSYGPIHPQTIVERAYLAIVAKQRSVLSETEATNLLTYALHTTILRKPSAVIEHDTRPTDRAGWPVRLRPGWILLEVLREAEREERG